MINMLNDSNNYRNVVPLNYIVGTDNRFWLINCPNFVQIDGNRIYYIGTELRKEDKVGCRRGNYRKRGYFLRNAMKCLRCSQRYGYTVLQPRTEET